MAYLREIISIRQPPDAEIDLFRISQEQQSPNFNDNYEQRRIERQAIEVELGEGQALFHSARRLVQEWRVFETPDGTPYPPSSPPEVGQTTINLLREFGIWFKLACRITKVVDESDRYGFTFETLPGHVECGWETFMVRYDADTGIVYYLVESESVHRYLIMQLASPLVHWLQRRYKSNSAKRMKELLVSLTPLSESHTR